MFVINTIKWHCLPAGLLALLVNVWVMLPLGNIVIAQPKPVYPQTDTAVVQSLIAVDKLQVLRKVDVIAHLQSALLNNFDKGKYAGSRFNMNQFRLEVKGKLHEKVFFRFRNQYSKASDPQAVDNLSASINLAYLEVAVSDRWRIEAGKLGADWGGIELDLEPIDVYQYSDIVQYADNFLTGVGVQFQAGAAHQLGLQLLNSRSRHFIEIYGPIPGMKDAWFPFAINCSWRGSMFDKKIRTIWSYNIFKEAVGTYMHYLAAGNQLVLDGFQVAYDFKYSHEDLDRKTIVSSIVIPDSTAVQHVLYTSHWLKTDLRVSRVVNLSLTTMVDFANWRNSAPGGKNGRIRTAWGIVPVVEFFPIKNFNLRCYVNYIVRIYKYSPYARQLTGADDYTTGVISVGLSAPLHIL